MTEVKLKRVYDESSKSDGYRVLVDRLWPRGMKKENLKYDLWAKDITPSPDLRTWFHQDVEGRWDKFSSGYMLELNKSNEATKFVDEIKNKPIVTLLYAAKDIKHAHVKVLKEYIERKLSEK